MFVGRNKVLYKYFFSFSGTKEVYINTSRAPEKCAKYFSGAGMVHINKYFLVFLSGAGEVYFNISPAPEK